MSNMTLNNFMFYCSFTMQFKSNGLYLVLQNYHKEKFPQNCFFSVFDQIKNEVTCILNYAIWLVCLFDYSCFYWMQFSNNNKSTSVQAQLIFCLKCFLIKLFGYKGCADVVVHLLFDSWLLGCLFSDFLGQEELGISKRVGTRLILQNLWSVQVFQLSCITFNL